MDEYIAYCGLDCKKCEAYLATITNDDKLREKVAKLWSKLNNVTITTDMINCNGCKTCGVKTVYCDSLCPIRKCCKEKHYNNCGECSNIYSCKDIRMIISNNNDALKFFKTEELFVRSAILVNSICHIFKDNENAFKALIFY